MSLPTFPKIRAGWAAAFVVLSLGAVSGEEIPYREPNFSARIVDVDAISLAGEERARVVAALSALARAEGTNNLVRMKAIAIALRLDNMDAAARMTNDLLIAGGPIVPGVEGGRDVSEAAATLEEVVERLRNEKEEEEDAVLVPYLTDILEGVRGTGPLADDQVLQNKLHWELVLGEATKVGGHKAEMEGKEVASLETTTAPASEIVATTPPEPSAAARGKASSGRQPVYARFMGKEASLRVVVFEDSADGEARALACLMSVKASEEARLEEARLDGFSPFHSSEGIRSEAAEQLVVAAGILRRKHSFARLNNRIDIELVSLEDGRTLPIADSRLGVPALFLFDALLTGAELDDEISVGGAFPAASERAAPRGRWGPIVEAAGRGGAKAVIVSASAETDLTDMIIAGNFSPLLGVQAIQINEADEVGAFLTGDRDPNAIEAMRLFEEVQDLTERLDVKDLLTNLKVQERLMQVLHLMPNHLSAKLLLGYGQETLPQRMSLRGSVRKISETIRPLRKLGQTANTVIVASTQDDLCADSLYALRRLRTSLAEGSLAYCDAAVDFVELLREFLKLSNRTTANAMKLGAEVEARRDRMETLRRGFEAALQTP